MDEALPIVTAAVICERVLVEKDEVVSAIRIFDRLQYAVPPPGIDPNLARIQFTFLVMLRRGDAGSRRHEANITINSPSGKEILSNSEPIKIEFPGDDPDAGVNIQIQLHIQPSEEGLHWLELSINGRVAARTPLRLFRQEPLTSG